PRSATDDTERHGPQCLVQPRMTRRGTNRNASFSHGCRGRHGPRFLFQPRMTRTGTDRNSSFSHGLRGHPRTAMPRSAPDAADDTDNQAPNFSFSHGVHGYRELREIPANDCPVPANDCLGSVWLRVIRG